jgi:hypothetical protein
VVFHSTIENRIERAKTYAAPDQNRKQEVYHLPRFQQALGHYDLLVVSGTKFFALHLRHEPLQCPALPNEHQHFGRCQQFREQRENHCGESFQVLVRVDDVCRLKEDVTVVENNDEDHVECVFVQLVQLSTRPKTQNFQGPSVHTYRGFPGELFHHDRD